MLYHLRVWGPGGHLIDGGWLAVDFFFVLSGFVLDHAYGARLAGGLGLGRFLLLRTIRLYPMVIAGVLVGTPHILLLAAVGRTGPLVPLAQIVSAAALVPLSFGGGGILFEVDKTLWSLFFEVVASIAFGAALFRLPTGALAFVTACAAGLLFYAATTLPSLNVGFRTGEIGWGLVRIAYPFLAGMLLHRVRGAIRVPPLPVWAAATALLACTALRPGSWSRTYDAVILLVAMPAIVLLSQACRPGPRSAGLLRLAAFLSFPVYALHYPVVEASFSARARIGGPGWLWIAGVVAVCLVGAALVSRWFEAPLRAALGRRFGLRSAAGTASARLP